VYVVYAKFKTAIWIAANITGMNAILSSTFEILVVIVNKPAILWLYT
jgi:hypothetical protein